jgi:hypothetical protein
MILGKKFSWQPHLNLIKSKLTTLTNVLTRLTASSWGAYLQILRLLYIAIICPAIITGCPAWWAPAYTLFVYKWVGEELQKVDN